MADQYPTPFIGIVTWTYASSAARLAATGFGPAHVGKFAFQASDSTYWRLVDDSPITWAPEPNGPIITEFTAHEPEWPGTVVKPYKDGGVTIEVIQPIPLRRWTLTYRKVSRPSTNRLIGELDPHYLVCLGQVEGFDFRDLDTGILYNDVHYESFKSSHGKRRWQGIREVGLIKRPPG